MNKDSKHSVNQKLEYSKPTLLIYGQFARMTAGGTGSITEAASGNKGNIRRA
jgi:hypothetical protein